MRCLRSKHGVIAIATAAWCCAMCDSAVREEPGSAVPVAHPVSDSLESTRSGVLVPSTADVAIPGDASGFLSLLGEFPAARAVGEADGDSSHVFGEIVDALLTPGAVVLLDRSYGRVRFLDSGGNPTGQIGGYGGGPGEFVDPLAVARHDGDTVVVADADYSVHRFVRGVEYWTFLDRFNVSFRPEDVCIVDGRMVLLGALASVVAGNERGEGTYYTIHYVDNNGRIQESFSPHITQSVDSCSRCSRAAIWHVMQGSIESGLDIRPLVRSMRSTSMAVYCGLPDCQISSILSFSRMTMAELGLIHQT